jgi:hypothetical protein
MEPKIRDLWREIKCKGCRLTFNVAVNSADYAAWKSGKLAQYAFPYLSEKGRELLIVGFCGDCYGFEE